MNLSKNKISEYLLYLSTAFVPFYILLPTNISVYEILVLSVFFIVVIDNNIRLPNIHLLIGLFLLLIGYTLSVINAGDSTSINIILQLPIIIIQSITLYSLIRTNKHLLYHCIAFTVPLIIIVVSYILLHLGINSHIELLGQSGSAYVHAGRLGLFYRNPNILALAIVMSIPSALFVYYYSDRLGIKMAYIIIISISVIILAESGSRSVFLSSILLLSLIISSYVNINQNKVKGLKYLIPSVFLLIVIISTTFSDSIIPKRVTETISGDRDIDRFEIWASAIEGYIISPFVGVGYGQTGYYEVPNPHNIILNPLVEGGIFAGLGAIYITLYLVKIGLYVYMNKTKYYFGIPFIISSLLYLVAAQFAQLYVFRFVWLCVIISYLVYDLTIASVSND